RTIAISAGSTTKQESWSARARENSASAASGSSATSAAAMSGVQSPATARKTTWPGRRSLAVTTTGTKGVAALAIGDAAEARSAGAERRAGPQAVVGLVGERRLAAPARPIVGDEEQTRAPVGRRPEIDHDPRRAGCGTGRRAAEPQRGVVDRHRVAEG